MKYLALGAAAGLIVAVALLTLPRKTYSDFPAYKNFAPTEYEHYSYGDTPKYDDYTYSGDFEYPKQ